MHTNYKCFIITFPHKLQMLHHYPMVTDFLVRENKLLDHNLTRLRGEDLPKIIKQKFMLHMLKYI